ncbi:MAG: hypothetical protein M3552_11285 [Planctomycetota bacterium]|nr:hypothetical protein [Planctomycetota bacterium]
MRTRLVLVVAAPPDARLVFRGLSPHTSRDHASAAGHAFSVATLGEVLLSSITIRTMNVAVFASMADLLNQRQDEQHGRKLICG